jgi:hypothetical protein
MYLFELPTTGAVSFGNLFQDERGMFASRVTDATSARSGVRTVLKEAKRAGDERDLLRVIKVSIISGYANFH